MLWNLWLMKTQSSFDFSDSRINLSTKTNRVKANLSLLILYWIVISINPVIYIKESIENKVVVRLKLTINIAIQVNRNAFVMRRPRFSAHSPSSSWRSLQTVPFCRPRLAHAVARRETLGRPGPCSSLPPWRARTESLAIWRQNLLACNPWAPLSASFRRTEIACSLAQLSWNGHSEITISFNKW